MCARTKVKRALLHNPRLAKRIQSSAHVDEEGRLVWTPEGRVTNVLVKLARGHAAYELSLICSDAPREVVFRPLSAMSASERESFEGLGAGEIRGCRKSAVVRFFVRAAPSPIRTTKVHGSWSNRVNTDTPLINTVAFGSKLS